MGNQQQQSYFRVISQLIYCNKGQERSILNDNRELVDQQLVSILSQSAEIVRKSGDIETAIRLEGVAKWLKAEVLSGLWGGSQEFSSKTFQLLLGSFQLIAAEASEAQINQIARHIAEQQVSLGAQFLRALPVVAETFFQESEETLLLDKIIPAGLLADAICLTTAGNRSMNIELAIVAYQKFLEMADTLSVSVPPLVLSAMKSGLGIAYKDRMSGNKSENIEKSIMTFEQALQLLSIQDTPVQWGAVVMNLSTAYQVRIEGDRSDNRERAIELCKAALERIRPEDNPVLWTITMTNLATSYKDRTKGEKADNFEKAISIFEECLKVRTLESMPDRWPKTMNNLGLAYFDRVKGDPAENIEKAIDIYEQVLQQVDMRRNAPFDLARLISNLATAYKDRIRGDAPKNTEKAIELYLQVFEIITEDDDPHSWATAKGNIALAYANRTEGSRTENIEQAIEASEAALKIFLPRKHPNDCRRIVHSLGDLYTQSKQWKAAVSTYRKGMIASDILYKSSLSLASQDVELKDTYDLFRRMAYAQAKSGDLEGAVVTVEQGRARRLRKALDRDRADLATLSREDPILCQKYVTAAETLRILESEERLTADSSTQLSTKKSSEDVLFAYQQYNEVVASIRSRPGYEGFLSEANIHEIEAVVCTGQTLVYILTSQPGSCALILTKATTIASEKPNLDITIIWLEDFTEAWLKDLIVDVNETTSGWLGDYVTRYEQPVRWKQTIEQTTAQLWLPIMKPIVNHLESQGIKQATLIPTSYLSLLPLHAAWTETSNPHKRYYALDSIYFTYAPSARSLKSAQFISQSVQAGSVLIVDEPTHQYRIGHDTYKSVEELPNAEREAKAVLSLFNNAELVRHEDATRDRLLSVLPQYDVLHCACHGKANLEKPLKSGLAMAGKGEEAIFSLRDLLSLKLEGLRLSVLSACETAIVGLEFEDEVVSLPSGFLQAGAAGVIASLWSVSDLSTMILLSRFYKLWSTQLGDPAVALTNAQRWLRDTNGSEIISHCETFIPELRDPKAKDLPKVKSLRRALKLSYSHPYHWAAFCYTGV